MRLSNSRRTRALVAAVLLGCATQSAAAPEPKGLTATVPVPADLHTRIVSGAGDASTAYLLHIDGVQFPANEPAVVHVFGNLPEAVNLKEVENSPHYLGYFTIVPRTTEEGRQSEKTEIVLDVTGNLPILLKNSRTLIVTLIAAGGRRIDKDLGLRFEKMYVTEEK
ncbi:MAG TPA: hypothetical protein VF756_31070 [Thermoanaerobaculia bacterium]